MPIESGFWNHFRRTIFPLFLIACCPPSALLMWWINTDFQGSLWSFTHHVEMQGFFGSFWHYWQPIFFGTPKAWSIILIFMLVALLLMRIVPGGEVAGPTTARGHTPYYKNNGFACFCITVIGFLTLSLGLHWFSITIFYDNFGAIISALNIFSLIFCLFLYFKGRYFPSNIEHGASGNFIFDYYWGTELYPRFLGFDLKQFTNCRFGMMSWPIIVLSFAGKQAALGGLSNTMLVCTLLQLTYIAKFFWWEQGYFRSLDIMHDRAGFYICWGCLVWVPAIYTSPILFLVQHPYDWSLPVALFVWAAGTTAIAINYLADRQRQMVRRTGGQCKVWGKAPKLIRASYIDSHGQEKQSLLLASGWWGLSRHYHYVPEILAAFFWTVGAGFGYLLPYFYVVFLTILLTHRALRDDERCAEKYGRYWEEYCRLVPCKIIPWQWFGLKF